MKVVLWVVMTVLLSLSVHVIWVMYGTLLLLLASVKLPVKPVRILLMAVLTVHQTAVLPVKQAFSSFLATQHVGFVHGHVYSA